VHDSQNYVVVRQKSFKANVTYHRSTKVTKQSACSTVNLTAILFYQLCY